MFFSLDRIEDGDVCVLVADDGQKYDVPSDELPPHDGIGSIFRYENEAYLFDETETATRRKRIAEKRKRLFGKAKQ